MATTSEPKLKDRPRAMNFWVADALDYSPQTPSSAPISADEYPKLVERISFDLLVEVGRGDKEAEQKFSTFNAEVRKKLPTTPNDFASESEREFGSARAGFRQEFVQQRDAEQKSGRAGADALEKYRQVAQKLADDYQEVRRKCLAKLDATKVDDVVQEARQHAENLAKRDEFYEASRGLHDLLDKALGWELPTHGNLLKEYLKIASENEKAQSFLQGLVDLNAHRSIVESELRRYEQEYENSVSAIRQDVERLFQDIEKLRGEANEAVKGLFKKKPPFFETFWKELDGRKSMIDMFLNGGKNKNAAGAVTGMVAECRQFMATWPDMKDARGKKIDHGKLLEERFKTLEKTYKDDAEVKSFRPQQRDALEKRIAQLKTTAAAMVPAEWQKLLDDFEEKECKPILEDAQKAGRWVRATKHRLGLFDKDFETLDKIVNQHKDSLEKSKDKVVSIGSLKLSAGKVGKFVGQARVLYTEVEGYAKTATDEEQTLGNRKLQEIQTLLDGYKPFGDAKSATANTKVLEDQNQGVQALNDKYDAKKQWEEDYKEFKAYRSGVHKHLKQLPGKYDQQEYDDIKKFADSANKAALASGDYDLGRKSLKRAKERLDRLVENPQGERKTSKNEVGKLPDKWKKALKTSTRGRLDQLAETAAERRRDAGHEEPSIAEMMTAVRKVGMYFDERAFDAVCNTLQTSEDDQACKKAREQGLRIVRDYQAYVTKDKLVRHVVLNVFGVDGIMTDLMKVLRDLEFNILRCV